MPANMFSIEDIASFALFKSQTEQNGEAFPTQVLLNPVAINKKALATCNSWSTLVSVMELTAQLTVGWRDQWDNGCCRLPSILHGANHRIHGLDEKLGPQVPPNFGRKGIAIEVLNSFCKCCFLVSSSSDFFLPLHCFVFLVCHYLDCSWHMIRIVTVQ